MTREEREQAIAILENEKKCVNRANKNDYCNRDCYNCELVKTDTEILTALDMAIQALEQSMPTMVYPQVDGITPTVVAQADGEKTCGTCRNEDTYHCAECENKSDYEQSQADGEYILKKDVMCCIGQTSLHWELARKLRELPSVAIPHDGEYISRQAIEEYVGEYSYKHGCNWIDNSVLYKFIKQLPSVAIPNKVGHWEYNQYDGNPNIGNWHCSECRNIVSDMPTCMGKPLYEFCPHCGSPMEIER